MAEDATELQRLGLGSFTFYKIHERLVKIDTGEEWHRYYDMVNLAYLDGSLPDGDYNLTLTAMDALGQPYHPGTSITFLKDTTTAYVSRATNLDVTACPRIRPPARTHDLGGTSAPTCGRCIQGVCVDGACLCEADWFGEACNFDIHDADLYMPGERTGGEQSSASVLPFFALSPCPCQAPCRS